MAGNLAPVFLDAQRVRLQGDPMPQVSRIVVAAGGKAADAVQVVRLRSPSDGKGRPIRLDEFIDRTEAKGPIHLRSVRPAPAKGASPAAMPSPVGWASGEEPLLDVGKAREELEASSMADIERATALTWGARAVASYQFSREARDLATRFRRFYEGENYRQEALEHAAMAGERAALAARVDQAVSQARAAALKDLGMPEAADAS